ncbi:MAG: LacI family DNA-binding transcriptional regulator [Eubacteriales bacterium]|nr:LacI family DNA-binding transcriptional regulator [Eubacteriales bacterium]
MNINEIARLSGVSRATVSRYFNEGYVSQEKRERIQQVIEQTGYKPSAQAQMLRTKKTKQVGVIIPKINSESISRMVAGIGMELKEAGFWLLLADTENEEREEVEYLKLFAQNQVDGIILIGTIFTPAHRRALRALQVPVVVLGQRLEGYSCVYQDDYHAAREAARLLLKDVKKPGYLGVTRRDKAAGEARMQGFLDAVREAGLEWDDSCYEESGFSAEDGYDAMEALWKRHPDLDAVFGATDSIALGAMGWLQETGHEVPGQVAVAGVGDTVSGRIVAPKLSSVHFFYRTSGQEAAKLLLALMNGSPAGKEIKMGYRVEPRETTRQQTGFRNF